MELIKLFLGLLVLLALSYIGWLIWIRVRALVYLPRTFRILLGIIMLLMLGAVIWYFGAPYVRSI
jgi:hypothetical protein